MTSEHSWLKTACSPWNVPLQELGGEWSLCPFVLTRWEIVQSVPTKVVLQHAKAATLCWNPLTFPYPIFLLAQNLTSKQIASTDNTAKVRQCQKVSYVVKGLNIYDLQYINFSSLRATSIVAILQVPDGTGILMTVNYGQIQSPCMEYKWMCYNGRLGSLLTLKLSTMQSKRHCSFSLSCDL